MFIIGNRSTKKDSTNARKLAASSKTEAELSCSFCGTSEGEVEKIVMGPEVYICNECVVLSANICGIATTKSH